MVRFDLGSLLQDQMRTTTLKSAYNFLIIGARDFQGGHGDRMVTFSPPTSEVGVRFPAWPQVRKLVVACRWLGSLQYRTLTNCMYWFPLPFQLPNSVESNVKPQINK